MHPEYFFYERLYSFDEDPGVLGCESGSVQLYPVAGHPLCRDRNPLQRRALLFNEDGTPTARSKKILSGTPTGRFVDSEELLGGVFFLCDDKAASAITGVVLPIDAGFSAYSGV